MNKIIWEEPPRVRRPPTLAEIICEALKLHPMRWGRVASGDHTKMQNLRKAIQKRDGFKAVARSVDGEIRLYARYVGEEEK